GTTGGFNYDYLNAAVPLTLAGRLRVSLRSGYVPPPAQVFRVVTSVSLSGAFANAPFGGRLQTTAKLGSFLVSADHPGVEFTAYRTRDLEGAVIGDAWDLASFGHTPLTAEEKLADADHDGASNYDEFRAGTDPNDPASVFKATLTFADGAATISFPCVE